MKLKVIFFCFTLLTLLTALVGLYLYYDAQRAAILNEAHTVSISHAKSLKNSIAQLISRYQNITLALSRHPELKALLARSSHANINRVNQLLDINNSSLNTSVCYLMSIDGVTIASSNRNDHNSFVGKDYSFRPYFKNAAQGRPFVYLALGITSGVRGIYFSNPVYDDTGAIIGVVVIKEDVAKLEDELLAGYKPTYVENSDLVFIIDENGVIFLTDQESLLYKTLWKVEPSAIEKIASTRQFGNGPWLWAGFQQTGPETVVDLTGRNYNLLLEEIEILPGWKIAHLNDSDAIIEQAILPIIRTAGFFYLFLFIFIVLVLLVLNYMAAEAEKTIRDSEARYRSVTETVDEGIILQSAAGEILTWNRAAENIFGISAEAAIGKTFDGKDWPTIREDGSKYDNQDYPSTRTIRTGKACRNEIMGVPSPSGEYRWISVNTNPMWKESEHPLLKGRQNKLYAVAISVTDITEQKNIQEALRKSEERLKLALDSVSEAVWDWQIDTGELYLSSRWYTMLGYRPNEFSQDYETWLDLVHPDDLPIAEAKLSPDLNSAEPFEIEFRMRTKEKQWRWILSRGKVVEQDDQGRAVRMLGTHMDITERKKAEKEHKKLMDRLMQAQKMESIGILAGGIAHDFNNILSSVIGFTDLALEEAQKGSVLEDSLLEVYSAGMRAKDLVKQILAFARKSDEERNPIQPKIITKEVLAFIRSTIPTTIKIRQDIDSDAWILGNSTQVYQVLMNLCTNAAQAMEESGGVLDVGMKDLSIGKEEQTIAKKPGEYIVITVSDTGPGVGNEIIESIFEPYFTTKGLGEGTGMGLAMVHGVVESYGGKITVDSELGKGTTFTVYLPVITKQPAQKVDLQEQLPTGKERILFVDDEAPIAKMGSRMLEKFGYSVVIRTSSIEALKLFESNPHDFDLVVTDMTMPNLTGDKLAIELMKIRPDIPVILCTGYSKKISDETASEIGIKAFAYKPVVKADLTKTVRKVLDEAMG